MSKRDRVIRSVLNECDKDVGTRRGQRGIVCVCADLLCIVWYIYIMYWLGMVWYGMVCACVCMLLQKIAHTFPHILTQTHTRALTRTHLFILFRARTYIKYMWHQLNFLKEHYKSNPKCVISLFHTVYLHTRSHTWLCVCVFVYACTLPFGTFPLLYCSNV